MLCQRYIVNVRFGYLIDTKHAVLLFYKLFKFTTTTYLNAIKTYDSKTIYSKIENQQHFSSYFIQLFKEIEFGCCCQKNLNFNIFI